MRKLALLLSFFLVASFAFSQALKAAGKAAGKTHSMTAEVVSVDTAAKTITIKDAAGGTKTVPVLDKATASLETLKAGDKVTLTCQDDEKGEHKGISGIKRAAVAKTESKPAKH